MSKEYLMKFLWKGFQTLSSSSATDICKFVKYFRGQFWFCVSFFYFYFFYFFFFCGALSNISLHTWETRRIFEIQLQLNDNVTISVLRQGIRVYSTRRVIQPSSVTLLSWRCRGEFKSWTLTWRTKNRLKPTLSELEWNTDSSASMRNLQMVRIMKERLY